jgi:hypothetical protein
VARGGAGGGAWLRAGRGGASEAMAWVVAAAVAASAAAWSSAASAAEPAAADALVAGRPRAGSAGTGSHGGLHRDFGRQRLRELWEHPFKPGAEAPPGPVPDPRRAAPPDRGE